MPEAIELLIHFFVSAISRFTVGRILRKNKDKLPSGDGPSWLAFIERVIGTTRREYLDHTVFFNEQDLQKKLNQFQDYYNERRVHSSLGFKTPKEKAAEPITNRAVVSLENYRWESHCKGLYQLPVAA